MFWSMPLNSSRVALIPFISWPQNFHQMQLLFSFYSTLDLPLTSALKHPSALRAKAFLPCLLRHDQLKILRNTHSCGSYSMWIQNSWVLIHILTIMIGIFCYFFQIVPWIFPAFPSFFQINYINLPYNQFLDDVTTFLRYITCIYLNFWKSSKSFIFFIKICKIC